MSYWYFFSYARVNKHPYLRKFYDDLWDRLAVDLTAAQQGQRSFRDWEDLELTSRWSAQLQEALEWSRVLVCITSPAYTSQEWCGKEVAFFDELCRYHNGVNERVLPVIWSKTQLPAVLEQNQYYNDSLPAEYLDLGLFRIMKLGKRGVYAKCVDALARGILEKGRKYVPRGPKPGLKLATIRGAFDGAGQFHTKVIYCSKNGSEWRPFRPPPEQDDRITDLVETVIARRQIGHEEIAFGKGLSRIAEQCADTGDPILIMLDPGSIHSEDDLASISELDREKHRTTALFVAWNNQDPEVVSRMTELQDVVNERICPRIAMVHPPIRSAKQLQQELNAALERFGQIAANRSSAERGVSGEMVRVTGTPAAS